MDLGVLDQLVELVVLLVVLADPGNVAHGSQLVVGFVLALLGVLLDGGSTEWSDPTILAQLTYLVIGGQVLVYLGAVGATPPVGRLHPRHPSTRCSAAGPADVSARADEAGRVNRPQVCGLKKNPTVDRR
jgi:hypothetical protein